MRYEDHDWMPADRPIRVLSSLAGTGGDWPWILPLSQLPAGPHQRFCHFRLVSRLGALAGRLAFGLTAVAKCSERGHGVARARCSGQILRVLAQVPPSPPVAAPGYG